MEWGRGGGVERGGGVCVRVQFCLLLKSRLDASSRRYFNVGPIVLRVV